MNAIQYCALNARHNNREESFSQVDSSQDFDDNVDHVQHQDDDSLNMLGKILAKCIISPGSFWIIYCYTDDCINRKPSSYYSTPTLLVLKGTNM